MPRTNQNHAVEEQVAATLRSLREQQGLTLITLAKAAGLSASYLSRVESNSASFTLQNLARVATALQVPAAAFFEREPATRPIVVSRRDAGKKQQIKRASGLALELPAADKRGKLMEPMLVVIKPVKSRPRQRSHPGEEYNLVLEGSCFLHFGKECLRLNPGDSVYYDASVPHAVEAADQSPCRLLAVVASRDYLFHGDISKLLQIPCK